MSDEIEVFDEEEVQAEDYNDEQPIEEDNIDENDDENDNHCESRFDIVDIAKTYENYHHQKKETKPFLTKFERAKIIGVRAEMIANGAIAVVSVPQGVSSAYEIAKLEFKERRIPLFIRRYLPNGIVEDWRLQDMVIFN
jgi:DNA-directed RNA polymerase I, II, and III subunit RPABC2